MSAIAEVKIIRDGKVAIKRVQLLGGNVEQEDEKKRLYYTFPKQLIEIVEESEVFGRRKRRSYTASSRSMLSPCMRLFKSASV